MYTQRMKYGAEMEFKNKNKFFHEQNNNRRRKDIRMTRMYPLYFTFSP